MTSEERQKVLDQLTTSEARILQLTNSLTPQQWSFRESPDRWSIAENIEHLILFENFIREVIQKIMQAPPEPEKKAHATEKEPLVLGLANTRHIKFSSREQLRPKGNWPTMQLMNEFHATRRQTIDLVQNISPDTREHYFAHIAFGELDCCQWLFLVGQHTSRHALQIEQIQTNSAYPAS